MEKHDQNIKDLGYLIGVVELIRENQANHMVRSEKADEDAKRKIETIEKNLASLKSDFRISSFKVSAVISGLLFFGREAVTHFFLQTPK